MELRVGAIYHWLGYEDEDLSRPMISSVEYLGLDVLGSPKPGEESRHFFRLVGSDQKIMFGEKHLPELADVPGLIEPADYAGSDPAMSRISWKFPLQKRRFFALEPHFRYRK